MEVHHSCRGSIGSHHQGKLLSRRYTELWGSAGISNAFHRAARKACVDMVATQVRTAQGT
jgi:hypothetical protein